MKKKNNKKENETFNSELKKPKIAILEVSSINLSTFVKFLISLFLVAVGFFLGYVH